MVTEKTQKALADVEEILKPLAVSISRPEEFRLDAVVAPENLHKMVEALVEAPWGYLSTLTGLDHPSNASKEENPGTEAWGSQIEVLYHFCEGAAIATLRVMVPYTQAVLPTVCDVIPTATLYERELMEMFGVKLEGTPNVDHLLLTDDWPEGVYPLRKSFTGLQKTA